MVHGQICETITRPLQDHCETHRVHNNNPQHSTDELMGITSFGSEFGFFSQCEKS